MLTKGTFSAILKIQEDFQVEVTNERLIVERVADTSQRSDPLGAKICKITELRPGNGSQIPGRV